jgi:hypothetical protein
MVYRYMVGIVSKPEQIKVLHVRSKKQSKLVKKPTIIFDIDQTLISSTESIHAQPTSFEHKTVSYTPHGSTELNHMIVYIRPGTRDILRCLYKHRSKFNVGFWSTGELEYVQVIVSMLLEEFNQFPTLILLARRVLEDGAYKIIDAITNKLYDYTFVRGVPAKNMQLLFQHPDFKNKFNKNATILIDDLPQNIVINKPNNVIKISGWVAKTDCDALTHLTRWLELNCERRTFTNLEMPILDKNSKFAFRRCNNTSRKRAGGAVFKKCTRRC